jgi:hypothetical protein
LELSKLRIADQTALVAIGVMMELLLALMDLAASGTTMVRRLAQMGLAATGTAMVVHPVRTGSEVSAIAMAQQRGLMALGVGGIVMALIVVPMVSVASGVIKAPNNRFERDAAKRRAPQQPVE